MSINASFGPRDDWDPPALSEEDQTSEDLAALGMHTTSGVADDDEDEDEDEAVKIKEDDTIIDPDAEVKDPEEEAKDQEEEAVDELKELERLERALQNDGRDLGDQDED